jgi:hypothetical protein
MKDYKKLLEGVVNIINTTEKSDIGFANICSYIGENCPEFKESEDEEIRKGLIKAFGSIGKKEWGGVNVKNAIAWLEKQKEFVSADFDDVWETADCEELTAPLEKYSKDAIKKMCHAWYDKGIELERRNWIEKQGEQKPQGKTALEAINEEKVDNQFCVKPVDKVESKFKIGDWVFSSVLGTARIIGVNDSNEYQLEYIDGKQEFSSIDYVNYAYDKWTLQDVKNGDVLYSPEHKLLWIYKNKEEYHASINLNCANFVSICAYIVIPSDVCPATKEQRDVLEKTMTKVGYKWNFEKKKLEIIDWSKHIKYEPNCPSITEKKSTWSE